MMSMLVEVSNNIWVKNSGKHVKIISLVNGNSTVILTLKKRVYLTGVRL